MAFNVNSTRRAPGEYTFTYGKGSKKIKARATSFYTPDAGEAWKVDHPRNFPTFGYYRAIKEAWGEWAANQYARPLMHERLSALPDSPRWGRERDDEPATPEPPTDPAGVSDFAVMRIASECRRYGVDAVAAVIERIRSGELPEKIAAEAMDRRIAAER